MAWDRAAAQAATQAAEKDLHERLDAMTPEQRAAIDALRDWWRTWYNGASGQHPTGHKALARLIVKGQ